MTGPGPGFQMNDIFSFFRGSNPDEMLELINLFKECSEHMVIIGKNASELMDKFKQGMSIYNKFKMGSGPRHR
jgi:hypothetical protein